jgi:hypothetical protein
METGINISSLVNDVMKGDEKLKLWEGSRNSDVLSLKTPQQKGELGVRIVKSILESRGHTVTKISDEGDLCINGEHSEVKYCTAKFNDNGEQLWWNQIRPKQTKWTSLQLVAMYPNSIKVWSFTREEYFNILKKMDKIVTPGHVTGNDASTDLEQVKFVKNSKRNELDKVKQFLIYEG